MHIQIMIYSELMIFASSKSFKIKLIMLILSKRAIQDDPLYFDIIPIYCSCLLEFNYIGELYSCAHNLVENHSNHPLAWYSVVINYYRSF